MNYTAYEPVNLEGDLIIPAAHVAEDTILNFKIMRNLADTSNYQGDLGILGIYWGVV